MSSFAIEIDNISYSYRSDFLLKNICAVKSLSLQIRSGESFGFLGHNGAGKTTTIKCLLNLIKPTNGRITIFGRDSSSVSSRAELGYLPEQPYFYDQLSVYELVTLYATLAGVKRTVIKEKVLAALERVNLHERLNNKIRALSKGLTQRVALAQAIVASPRLLILDEPFSGLDPIGRAEFKEIFKELKSQSVTIFICTHILSDAEFLCDRVSIMARGELKGVYELRNLKQLTGYQLVLCGDRNALAELSALSEHSEQIIETTEHQLRLSFGDYTKAQAALEKALKAGCIIRSFEPRQASLEDLFKKVVKIGGAT